MDEYSKQLRVKELKNAYKLMLCINKDAKGENNKKNKNHN